MLKFFNFSKNQAKTKNIGNIVLVDEIIPKKSLEIFLQLTENRKGLIISRQYIKQIKKIVPLKDDIKYIWLAFNEEFKDKITPKELNKIKKVVKNFVEKNENSVIYFDGIHYLSIHHNIEKVIEIVVKIMEYICTSNSKFICTFNSEVLEENVKVLYKLTGVEENVRKNT